MDHGGRGQSRQTVKAERPFIYEQTATYELRKGSGIRKYSARGRGFALVNQGGTTGYYILVLGNNCRTGVFF